MALNALTLSVTSGVQGRPFQATISGLTTGRVEVLGDASPGFSTVNGKVMSSGLPYPVSTVALREYEPGVGAGFRDSRIDITAATTASLRAQAVASLATGRTLARTRVAGTRQPDGSLVYSLIVEDDLGASSSLTPQPATGTPAPSPTPTPSAALSGVIVNVADSIGAGTATSGYNYLDHLGFPSSVTTNNSYAISGHEIAGVAADIPGGLAPLYTSTKPCVVILERGTNDLGNANRTAADAYAFWPSIVAQYKAQGFYTAICTLLPRTGTAYNWSTAKISVLNDYNALVRANSAGADVVIDLFNDPIMGAPGATTNTSLYVDQLHPTTSGQDRLAVVFNAALTPLLQMAPRVPAQGSASAFTMTQLASANRVYQRSTMSGGGQGKGTGTIPVAVNVTTTGAVYARIRSSDGSTILQEPIALGAFAAIGAQTLNVTGVDARLGWFYLDLSPDGSTWQNGTVLVGMGRVLGASGQSLAVRMFGRMDSQTATNATLGVAPSANSSVYATYTDGQRTVSTAAWTVPADGSNYDSTFAAEFLRLQVANAGVNCALVGHSKGAQSITVFVPGGDQNASLRAILSAVGGFEGFLWMQGHNDAGTGMSSATYQSNLTALFSDITAYNGVRGGSYDKLLCTIPNISANSYGTYAQKQVIRNAANTWASSNSGSYVDMRDLALVDGVHQSQAGGIAMARHFYRASRPYLGLSRGDAGPTFSAPQRASGSVNVVLNVSFPAGASALASVGSPATRFAVYNSGDLASPLALDSTTPITISGSTITLKLAAAPADSQALDVYFCPNPDPAADGSASMIYDNNAGDGDGLTTGRQLTASLAPTTVDAPTMVAPTNSAAPAVSGTPQVGNTLTTTNGTWSNSPTGYTYQWQYADTAANISGATAQTYAPVAGDVGHTIRCIVTATNAVGSTSANSNTTAAVAAAGSTKVGPNLAVTGTPTYQAGKSGFGQEMAGGGYGASATTSDAMPAGNVWTIEGIISIAAAPSSIKVAFGAGNKCWVGVNAQGRLVTNFTSGTSTDNFINGSTNTAAGTNPVVSDGVRRHVALVSTGSSVTLYVDGTAVGTSAVAAKTTAASSAWFIGGLQGNSSFTWPGTVDEQATWNSARYSATFTPPTAPYVGNESGMYALYHLNGNLNAATY